MASAVLSVLPNDIQEKIWKHVHQSCIQDVNRQITFLAGVAKADEDATLMEWFDGWSVPNQGIREGVSMHEEQFGWWRDAGFPEFMPWWVGDGFNSVQE